MYPYRQGKCMKKRQAQQLALCCFDGKNDVTLSSVSKVEKYELCNRNIYAHKKYPSGNAQKKDLKYICI